MMIIEKRFNFCCSHRLFNPKWSKKKNQKVFGKCCNVHGHNYSMLVRIEGPVDEDTGMVMNFTDIAELVQNKLFKLLDHKNLETDLPELSRQVLTVENMVVFAWGKLALHIKPPARLKMIRMEETESNAVEYFGPEN